MTYQQAESNGTNLAVQWMYRRGIGFIPFPIVGAAIAQQNPDGQFSEHSGENAIRPLTARIVGTALTLFVWPVAAHKNFAH